MRLKKWGGLYIWYPHQNVGALPYFFRIFMGNALIYNILYVSLSCKSETLYAYLVCLCRLSLGINKL